MRRAHRSGSSAARFVSLLPLVLLAACAEEPGSEMPVRECLFVASVAIDAERFLGQEVAVCGSIDPHGSVNWLVDGQRPRRAIALHFPTTVTDPGMQQVLDRLEAWNAKRSKRVPGGRFHGRVVHVPGYAPTLQVQRVDWVDTYNH